MPAASRPSSSRTAAGESSTRNPSLHYGKGLSSTPAWLRVLFQTALDLAEERQGGLLVVVADPARAIGRLIAPHDMLVLEEDSQVNSSDPDAKSQQGSSTPLFSVVGPTVPSVPAPGETGGWEMSQLPGESLAGPLSKRSLHYLARGASVSQLDPAVLEALAGLDGALVTDSGGRLLAFGAILRHDLHALSGSDLLAHPAPAEGARTTAAIVASHFGPVLKISEDGIVSCFLDGVRVWDL